MLERPKLQIDGELVLLVGRLNYKFEDGTTCGCINGKLMQAAGIEAPFSRAGLVQEGSEEKIVRSKFSLSFKQQLRLLNLNDLQKADQLKTALVRLGLITKDVTVVIRKANQRVEEGVRSE